MSFVSSSQHRILHLEFLFTKKLFQSPFSLFSSFDGFLDYWRLLQQVSLDKTHVARIFCNLSRGCESSIRENKQITITASVGLYQWSVDSDAVHVPLGLVEEERGACVSLFSS